MMSDASFGGILRELMALLADAWRELAVYTLVLGALTTVGVWAGLTETSAGTLNMGFRVDASDGPASASFGPRASPASSPWGWAWRCTD
jgi:hypothetical protein